MLLITHNLAVVAYLAEKVYVMYAGKVMEWGDKAKVLREPEHPYTKALMSAVPIAGQSRTRTVLRGDPPNLIDPPLACRFHPRCPVAFNLCGWRADEVAEDLTYLIMGKYYATFGDGIEFEAEDDRTLVLRGTADAAKVRSVVAAEREEARSLQGIESVTSSSGSVVLRLHPFVEPQLYQIPDGREVACLLFRPDARTAPPPAG